jgi:2-methylisocitrate lyase-like PEP mutase family enzyme
MNQHQKAAALRKLRGAIAAGAVGMNFEDSIASDAPLLPVDAQVARFAADRISHAELNVLLSRP